VKRLLIKTKKNKWKLFFFRAIETRADGVGPRAGRKKKVIFFFAAGTKKRKIKKKKLHKEKMVGKRKRPKKIISRHSNEDNAFIN
jgi:hypothetical protein